MEYRNLILSCLLYCMVLLPAAAQFPEYQFRYYDVNDGLPSNEVICIGQDAQGFIRIGTNSGLCTFDGIKFTPLKGVSPTKPFPAVAIRHVLKDRKGGLWISGDYNGAVYYNPATGSYQGFSHNEKDIKTIGDAASYRMLEDREGNIWFAHYFKGLSKYNPTTGEFTRFRKENAGLGSNIMLNIFEDSKGNILAGTADAGIYLWNKSRQTFIPYAGNAQLPGPLVNCITEDKQGTYWLATASGIVHMSREGSLLKIFSTDNSACKSNLFYNVYTSPGGLIYGCSPQGLHIIDPLTYQMKVYTPFGEKHDNLFTNRCTNLYFDAQGDLWAQFNEGFCYATDRGNKLYGAQYIDSVISQGRYNEMEYLSDNVLWNINSKGLQSKNLLNGNIKSYHIDKPLLQAAKQNGCIFSESKGAFISFYIPGTGIVYLHKKTGSVYMLPPIENSNVFHTHNNSTFCDSRNAFWGMDDRYGLVKFSFVTKQWSIIDPEKKKPKHISYYYYTRFMEDHDGNIWIANPYYRLLKYNVAERSFRSYRHEAANPFSLSMQLPQSLLCDHAGNVWIGGIGGTLDLYDKERDRFIHFHKGSIFDRHIEHITEDNRHDLWCFTPLGIIHVSKLHPDYHIAFSSDFDIAEYNNHNGITGYYFGNNCVLHHPDGRMIFDAKDGIAAIYPAALGRNHMPPPVYFTDISINGTPLADASDRQASCIDTLYLSHTEHNISVEFAALNYLYPESNSYKYILEGFEKEWHYTAPPNLTAIYSNLAPGRYKLRVIAANNDGLWNEAGRTLLIIIRPAFWQTWWFRTLIAVAVIALLYILFRFRIRQLLKLQQVRNRISRDLHDDIGATVSSVNISAKLLQDNLSNPDKAIPLVDKIRRDVQFVGESLDDIVWSVNPKNDNWEQLSVRMRRYWADLLEHRDIANRFVFPDNIDLSKHIPSETRKELFLIFKEAANNIAKHSGATEAFCIINISDNHFSMTIRDNGKGFDPGAETDRNGLKNMQARAAAIKAGLIIDSSHDKGTVITLSLNL